MSDIILNKEEILKRVTDGLVEACLGKYNYEKDKLVREAGVELGKILAEEYYEKNKWDLFNGIDMEQTAKLAQLEIAKLLAKDRYDR